MAIPGIERNTLIKALGRDSPRILAALDMADLEYDTQWDDSTVVMLSVRVPATGGPDFVQFKDNGSGSTGVFGYAFDPTSDEQVYSSLQMSHSAKEGSTIYPHVHWSPAANGTAGQKVSWGVEATIVQPFEDFPDTTIYYGNTHLPADSVLVAGRHYITAIGSGIALPSSGVSAVMMLRFFRDASGTGLTDDLAQDAFAISFDAHYEKNSIGSDEEYTK